MNRRYFIKSLGRNLMVAGLLAGGTYLALRKGEEGEACNFDFVCKNCKQLQKCALPEARDFKKKENIKRG